MTRVISHRGRAPRIADGAFLAASATVAGDVEIGPESSVWFGSVLRGDVEPIRVGRRTNLQDLVVVHVTDGKGPAVIGDGVTVGHRAVVHGCTIHDDSLVGIGAVVLDGAEVGPASIVGAGARVPPGMRVPPRTLALGVPAKVVRELTDDEVESIRRSAARYVALRLEYPI
jgi:carbonic anhydrase/acetyltransferase-like protein (isoleucine patch superfamily)